MAPQCWPLTNTGGGQAPLCALCMLRPCTLSAFGHNFSMLCLWRNVSKTQEMNSLFFPLPLLFQNSAAFLEESKQNKCDYLKNYWKMPSS